MCRAAALSVLFVLFIVGSFVVCSTLPAEESGILRTWPENGKKSNVQHNRVLQVFPKKPIKELGNCQVLIEGTPVEGVWEKDDEGYYAIFRSDEVHQDKWCHFIFRATCQSGDRIETIIRVQLAAKPNLMKKVWKAMQDLLLPHIIRFNTRGLRKTPMLQSASGTILFV